MLLSKSLRHAAACVAVWFVYSVFPGKPRSSNWTTKAADYTKQMQSSYKTLHDTELAFVTRIESHRQSFQEALAAIRAVDVEGERQAMEELRQMALILHKVSLEIIEAHEKFQLDTSSYEKVMQDAYPVFVHAAKEYETFANEEPFWSGLQDSYRQESEILLATAEKIRTLSNQIGPAYAEVQRNLEQVRRTELFLRRFDSFALAIPNTIPDARLFSQMKDYVLQFNKFKEDLQLFHGNVVSKTPVSVGDYQAERESYPDSQSTAAKLARSEGAKSFSKRQWDQAIASYGKAIDQDPGYAGAYINRGDAFRRKKDFKSAIADYSKTITLKPQFSTAYRLRAVAEEASGNDAAAVKDYKKCVELRPNCPVSQNALAWLLATTPDKTLRDPLAARSAALNACSITGFRDATHLNTLAAAEAAGLHFDEAIRWQKRSIELITDDPEEKDRSLLEGMKARLALYSAHEPLIQP